MLARLIRIAVFVLPLITVVIAQPGTHRRAWTAGSGRRGLSHQEAS